MAEHLFTIKRNDTSPSIKEILTLGGVAIDLTGAAVIFRMTPKGGTTPKVNAAASVVAPATQGLVRYSWIVGDTDTSGDFIREWQVTLSDGSIVTVPNDVKGYPVAITDDQA